MEVYRIPRYPYGNVRIKFGIFHCFYKFFAVNDVYVKVVRALLKVSVQHARKILNPCFLVFSECGRKYGKCVGYSVSAILITYFRYRIKRRKGARNVPAVHRVCAGRERFAL